MARSLKSKRRRKNKQVLRERYKPKYDAQLQSIVANMQKETEELMETAGDIDLEGHIKIIDPDKPDKMEEDGAESKEVTESKKNKLPKVDMKKVAKFLSQRKNRKYQKKVREKNQSNKRKVKGGGGVQKKTKPSIKW